MSKPEDTVYGKNNSTFENKIVKGSVSSKASMRLSPNINM